MVATQNTEWGFWGTFSRNWTATEKETLAAWNAAVKALTAAGYTEEETRSVLDGQIGRHIADQVDKRQEVGPAVAKLIVRWEDSVAQAAGRNPAAQKIQAEKVRAAQAKQRKATELHKKAAINYAVAVAGQDQKVLPRRERELRRAAIALGEAIRELASIR